jgi:hypothetical protein
MLHPMPEHFREVIEEWGRDVKRPEEAFEDRGYGSGIRIVLQ